MFHGILAYMLLGFVLTLKDKPEKNLLCLLGWFSFVLIGCIMLFWAYANSPYASNARYGYILVPIAAAFFRAHPPVAFQSSFKNIGLIGLGFGSTLCGRFYRAAARATPQNLRFLKIALHGHDGYYACHPTFRSSTDYA